MYAVAKDWQSTALCISTAGKYCCLEYTFYAVMSNLRNSYEIGIHFSSVTNAMMDFTVAVL